MKSPLIVKKFSNILNVISLIAGLNTFTPSYASFSSLREDSSESSESGKITGSKRLRDENSDSPKIKTKKQRIKAKEESKSLSSKEEFSSEEKSGLTENLGSPNIAFKEDIKDVFYIFNVGQGNSQLAIYSEGLKEPFGVLYDCGSSAENVHPKISKARSSQGYNIIISRKEPEEENDNIDFNEGDFNISSLPISLESSSKRSIHMSSRTSSGNISYDAERETLIDVSKLIKETIEDYHIKYLFVILSHPDKDHINLVSSVIPEGIKSLLLLCGDFLQESDSASGKLKQDAQSLFKFIKEKGDCKFSLPYFWNFSKYADIKASIKNYAFEQDKPLLTLSKESRQSIKSTPSPLYGSFFDLLNLMDEKEGGEISPYLTSLLQRENIKQKLDNIYIWGLNKYASDINDQSIIVSFRIPSLGKSFICTGDAREDVFVDIYQSIRNQERFKIDKENQHCARTSLHNDHEENTVVLVLPHHGSFENLSFRMLDLFKPDILAISAGAGMYPHPSNKLIKEYKNKYRFNSETRTSKLTTNIWKDYRVANDCYYLSFIEKLNKNEKKEVNTNKKENNVNQKSSNADEKKINENKEENKEKVGSAVYKKIKEQKKDIPILCTNTLGTIKITKDDFASEYTNLVLFRDDYYKIDLSKHLEINGIEDNKQYNYINFSGLDFYVPVEPNMDHPHRILLKIERKTKETQPSQHKKGGRTVQSKKKVAYYYEGTIVREGEM